MKIVVIDGVEYEEYSRIDGPMVDGAYSVLYYRALPPTQKTIVQVAAEAGGYAENKYREEFKVTCASMDAIEQRLQALERKLEGK